jgi:hypothetical protein
MAGREMRRLDGTGQARHHRLGQTGILQAGWGCAPTIRRVTAS